MKLELNENNVMVEILQAPEQTESGIIVTRMKKTAAKGLVVSSGYNAVNDPKFNVKEGDIVYFPSADTIGTNITLEGKEYKILDKSILFFKEVL